MSVLPTSKDAPTTFSMRLTVESEWSKLAKLPKLQDDEWEYIELPCAKSASQTDQKQTPLSAVALPGPVRVDPTSTVVASESNNTSHKDMPATVVAAIHPTADNTDSHSKTLSTDDEHLQVVPPLGTLARAVYDLRHPPSMTKQTGFCHVLWCDPNLKNNQRLVNLAHSKGYTVINCPSAKDGIEFLRLHPECLFMHDFRILTNNSIYVNDPAQRLTIHDVLDAKMSAAEDIIRYLRGRRSTVPVLMYAQFTYPHAEKLSKEYTHCKATKDMKQVESYVCMEPSDWIPVLL